MHPIRSIPESKLIQSLLKAAPWLSAARHGVSFCEAQVSSAPGPAQAISTDRPTFTDASTTVPCRALQFEKGFHETAAKGQRGWDLSEILVRFGATTKAKLRFTAPEYFWNAEMTNSFASRTEGTPREFTR